MIDFIEKNMLLNDESSFASNVACWALTAMK
jgi:hypothetical protein